jgi:phospholipid/cholesterol/gamma-HCH transport system substrate-binding protein
MISRAEKIRLGAFLVVSCAVLIVTAVVLAGLNIMKQGEYYKVVFSESVSGLEVGAQVKYSGVRVGQVADIRIDPERLGRVVVVLELRKGTPVKQDTKAVLSGMGITGIKFVELTGGSNKAARLRQWGTIQAGHSFMGTIEGKAEDIAVKTELALNKINTVLSEQNIARIEDVLSNLKDITDNANKLVADNDDKVSAIVADLSKASGDLRQGMAAANSSMQELEALLQNARPGAEETVLNMAEASRGFKKTAADLAKVDDILRKISVTLKDFDDKLAAVDVAGISDGVKQSVDEASAALKSIRRIVESSRENVFASSKSLKRTLRNLEEFSAEIRDQPSLLLSKERPKDRTPPEE